MKKTLNLFGCESSAYDKAELVLLAVPWSATASFGGGAEEGPEMIAHASSQMDFFSKERGDIRDKSICFLSPSAFLKNLNRQTRKKALPVIALEEKAPGDFPKKLLDEINQACSQMVNWVYEETKNIHSAGKKFGLVGGDHSTSEGAIRYFSEIYKGDFGVLHIDAHADLRKSYQGFKYSHASVMYNVIHQPRPPVLLVQVGVRDYSGEEYALIKENKSICSEDSGLISSSIKKKHFKQTAGSQLTRLETFFDSDIKTALFEGKTWKSLADSIIQSLPQRVYISLDVDGLKPHLFPHTGAPVPGGLSFEQTEYLLNRLTQLHRQIIGFDLVETAHPKGVEQKTALWDAQVGARLLLCLTRTLFD